ncbi:glycosyltransferase [Xenorhabdus nematophila]|uniref:glycosyltransferase n=1 Tax=Xenorhabdus nematophila TaxID=628 RepID=UPI00032753CD|nr:glycosyltransferase [Xenorhabdus nematophila]CEF30279.1 hypothetical protein XNW1_2390016 [Xenorhabdus nematophila str. Websteri]AYA41574.1 glycosyltransferase family 1 protein [Xenorhabdus nematophila]MBA0020313.1 glycosyltransferase [Xenorhabdus nematophila]MCB4426084.1 hypothetical protein [Xenorhabdus nematophila]QNJ35965.1 glycosyltransferase [Xenorhabdus nematophila]
MAGLPVLTSNLYEMKSLVETENVGIVATENTVQGFKNAINTSLQLNYSQLQNNVYKTRNKYCWEQQEKTLYEIYHEI